MGKVKDVVCGKIRCQYYSEDLEGAIAGKQMMLCKERKRKDR